MDLLKVFLSIGLVFSPIAALMAFIITYEEYLKHYTDKKRPFQLAVRSAITTLLIFMLISVAGGMIFNYVSYVHN